MGRPQGGASAATVATARFWRRGYLNTGNFARQDFSVSYKGRDDLTVRTAVTNAFDAEQPSYLGTTLYSNFDPYGRRFFVGLNYRPW